VPVVEAAAIIGRYVDRSLLRAVSAQSADEVDDVIDELEDARVLEPFGVDRWRSARAAARGRGRVGPPSVRRGLHGRAADALVEGVAGANPDWRVVADHYERAERFDDAALAYRQAAVDAGRRGASDEARTYLTRALDGLDRTRARFGSRPPRAGVAATAGILRLRRRGHGKPDCRSRLRALPAIVRYRLRRRPGRHSYRRRFSSSAWTASSAAISPARTRNSSARWPGRILSDFPRAGGAVAM